ncbi:MAG: OmpA family protein, partial [Persicimonas sp.]
AMALTGCSTPPKPKELVELERILQDPEARQVKEAPGASKFYREARQYRRVALEAYNDGELERAQEYSILGKLRYRTAAAVQEQHKAKKRLDEANAKVGEVNPEIQSLNQERNKLNGEVGDLERKVARARNEKAQRERRKKALEKASLQRNDDTSDAEARALRNKLDEARDAKEAALDVRADEFAKGAYNRGNNQLKSTLSMLESGSASADAASESADQATKQFRKAAQEARPKFQEQQKKMQPAARRAALQKEAENNFGGRYTFQDGRGVRVVLAMLFEKGEATIRPQSVTLVKTAAKLAKKYDEAEIVIEGYTRKGNPTANLATSQLRAKKVRDEMKSEGVKDSRMSTTGEGQDRIRFADDAAQNDRVEIIFRIRD